MPTKHLDSIQAGAQITRDNLQWGTTLGTAFGPITYGFRSSSTTGTSTERATFSKVNAAEMAAVEDALRLWSNLAHISFTEVNPGGYTNSATILVGNYSSASDGAAAYAYYPSPGSTGGTSSAGDVWINTYYQSNLSPAPGNYAYLAIMHEIGHALGLEHPGNYNAGPGVTITYANNAEYVEDSRQYTVMSYFDASATGANHVYQGTTIRASTPLLHDVAAIQRLYGVNTEYATGDTVYGFNSNADSAYHITSSTHQVVYCIWDAGGNDTVDLSGYGTNQTIDLRSGSFSDVGALTRNVSIALGAMIENAIGGSGNDTMIGNDAANHLVGGTGDDRLTGGGGDDLLDGGGGFDTAIFLGLRAFYTIQTIGDDIKVFGAEGIDTLRSIDALQFTDVTVTLQGILPAVGIAGVQPSGPEGDGGTTILTFAVILDQFAQTSQTVSWAITGSGSFGASGADFVGGLLPSGTLTFAAGETSKTISVAVAGDTDVEFDEGFTVTLSNASSGMAIGTPSAIGQILNDDRSVVSIGVQSADRAEGNDSATSFIFTVSLAEAGVAAQSVDWAVTGSSSQAADAADFGGALPSGTVSFAAGETSKTIVMTVVGDLTVEADEAFLVTLSGPTSGLAIASGTAVGTIRNDDASVSIAILAADKPEGHAGTTALTFAVTRAGDISTSHSVGFAVAGAGAGAALPGDFAGGVLPTGRLTFDVGDTSAIVTVLVTGDKAVEPDETFAVTLMAPSAGLTVGVATALGTIRNDDAAVVIAGLAAEQAEGQTGVTAFTFQLMRTGDSTVSHSVAYSVTGAGDNPASPADFPDGVLPSGVVTFAPGELTRQIALNVLTDAAVEPDETFEVTLSAASTGLAIEGPTALGTILNDDAAVSIAALSANQAEGHSGGTPFTFVLTLAGDKSLPRTVAYAVAGAGADPASGTDFSGGQLPSGVVTFSAGEASRTLVVSVAGDSQIEPNKDFTVSLSAPSPGLSIATATAAGSIRNDDAVVSMGTASVSLAEGNSGISAFIFSLTRTGDSTTAQSVLYAVTGSDATPAAAGDFLGGVLPSGSVTFAAGEISRTITVSVVGDAQVEADEAFVVSLSNPSPGLTIGVATATGAIRNDDAAVSITALSASPLEGNAGSTSVTFMVTLAGDSSVAHSIAYGTSGSGSNPATADDFAGNLLQSGTVGFAVGETSRTITLDVMGDPRVEPDETFVVSLSNPSPGLVVASATAVGTIRNDDASVSIAPLAADRREGSSGTTGFTFVLTLTGDATVSHSVTYAASGTGANAATAADFAGAALASGAVTFEAGETSKTIVLDVAGDAQVEADEAFVVTLSGPSAGLVLGTASATGTIRNDDAAVSIVAASGDQPEGNSGVTGFAFTLTRSGDRTVPHSVAYAVTGSGSDPATADDFLGGLFPAGIVTFVAGEATRTIVVSVSGDAAVEPDQGFTVTLGTPSPGLSIATASAASKMLNDDAVVSVTTLAVAGEEGQSGSTAFTFVLFQSGDRSKPHTIDYSVSGVGDFPVSGADFAGGVLPSGTVSFAVGETSRTIVIGVAGDSAVEPDETFALSLSNPSPGLSTATGVAVGTIRNDDASVSIVPLAASPSESDVGGAAATFLLTLTGDSSVAHGVTYAIEGAGGNPASADDFSGDALPSGSVTFAAGEITKVVSVMLAGDREIEQDETFSVSLSAPSPGLVVDAATALGTIRNDDASVSIAALSAARAEGNSGATSFTFVLTLTGDDGQARSVSYAVGGSGAAPATGADFQGDSLPSGVVVFGVGETSKTIVVGVSSDIEVEPDETFAVSLSGPSANLTIGTATAVGTIRNDDATVSIEALAARMPEGDSGATGLSYVLMLSGDSSVSHGVTYAVSGAGANPASATDFADGVLPSGTVSFAVGETSKTISVRAAGDRSVEPDEGFVVTLSVASTGWIIGTPAAAGTILNDDKSVASIASLSADGAEGDVEERAFTFRVNLDQPGLTLQTVDWSVSGMGPGAAEAADFGGALPSGSVTFAAGESSGTIAVRVRSDAIVEPDEAFAVTLSNPSPGLAIGTAMAAGTIRNDDASVSIAPLSADRAEGDVGGTSFFFTVIRSGDVSVSHSVAYGASGTGVSPASPANFPGGALPSGFVTFAAGETSKTISVVIEGDVAVEPDETFAVTLSSPSAGLTVEGPAAPGTIRNDDASVSIVPQSAVLHEGNVGTALATFTLLISGDTTVSHSIAYAVSGSDAAPASAGDFDGGAMPSGRVTFAPGETSRTISIGLAGDMTVEPDESFAVTLSGPSVGLTVEEATAAGTIVNDDAIVSITAVSSGQREGDSETTAFVFSLSRAGDSSAALGIAYSVAGVGGNPTTAGDFVGGVLPAGTLTFAAGETSRTIVVPVAADLQVEPDEAFTVTLSTASTGLALGVAEASATILNDDRSSVSIVASSADKTEGNGGLTPFSFLVKLDQAGVTAQTIGWTVTGVGAHAADEADFGGSPPFGTISFAAGETSKTIAVMVTADFSLEPDEAFIVGLAAPSAGLVLATATASGTIRNDDLNAQDDAYVALRGQTLHIAAAGGVLSNDEGTVPTTASLVSGPTHGTLTLAADGSFDYVPAASFIGVDGFTYRATGANGTDDGQVQIYLTPVSAGATVTVDLLALGAEQQIAATYTAFFGRGADAAGFVFWLDQFNRGLPIQGASVLFANIASAFAISDEAKALYPFLANPLGATDSQIGAFIDSVYSNLFNRASDAAGRSYWAGQIHQTLAAGQFVGSVLVDIIGGAQNSASGQDVTTLIGKVAVNLEYVHEQQRLGTPWTAASDAAEATALLHGVTADPRTVLVGIAQAQNLVAADAQHGV